MHSKIGNRIFVAMLLVAVIPLVLLFVYISVVYSENIKTSIEENNQLMKENCVDEFESYLRQIEYVSNQCYEDSVQTILQDKGNTAVNKYINQESLTNIFNIRLDLFGIMNRVESVSIQVNEGLHYDIKGNTLISDEFAEELYEEAEGRYKYQVILPVPSEDNLFIYGRNIRSVSSNGKYLGVIYITFQEDVLIDILDKYMQTETSFLTITDKNDNLIYTNYSGEEVSFQEFFRDEQYYDSYDRADFQIADFALEISFYNEKSLTEQAIYQLLYLTALITIVSCITIIILSKIMSQSLVRPIIALKKGVEQVKSGNYQWKTKLKSDDELTDLSNSFQEMAIEIDTLINQIYSKEISEKEAVIASLTAQINPHFLYNTLDMVKSMAEIEGVDEIGEIAKALSVLFRYSTRTDVLLVTVKEEVSNLENYIKIIDARFGDKIQFVLDIQEEAMPYSIIKLCLQPLVENSINHGLVKKNGKGIIGITITCDDRYLYIVEYDTGVGMKEDDLEEVQIALNQGTLLTRKSENGVGLNNINQRIKLYYGNEYGLSLGNYKDEGLSVQIKIPLKHNL
ncbi:MAG: histidine kinase [Eubacteriales bacterium]